MSGPKGTFTVKAVPDSVDGTVIPVTAPHKSSAFLVHHLDETGTDAWPPGAVISIRFLDVDGYAWARDGDHDPREVSYWA